MNKKLSCRDFLKLAGVTSAGLALSACGVKATELPTATLIPPTGTPLPTETLTPTLTSTPTTPLEQLPLTQKAFTEFVQAFQTVGVNVSTDQLIQKGLEVRTVTDKDEKQYDIAFVLIQDATTQLDGDYPLIIKTDGIWKNIGLRSMSSIPIGTSTIWDLLDTNKSEYNQLREKFKEIYSTDFNAYTFQMGWKHIQPENQDKTNFDIIDWQLKQLKELGLFNGINNNLSAQSLIYAKESPDWLKNGNFSREQMIEFMTKYIKSVMTRYKGIIKQWIVVNEPAGEDLKGWVRTDDFLYSKIGADYIDIAFQIAREADPSAILIFNDTDNHTPTGHTTSNTRSIANRLKEKG